MNLYRKLRRKVKEYLIGLQLRQKIRLLFAVCVMLPMLVTDAIILANEYRSTTNEMKKEFEQSAAAVEFALQSHMEYPSTIAHNIYKSRVLHVFLNEQYDSPYEYYDAYYRIRSESVFDASMGIKGATVSIFSDNDTISDGSGFYNMAHYENEPWLKKLYQEDANRLLLFEYSTGMGGDIQENRRVVLLRKLNMGQFSGCKKALRMDLDYSDFEDELRELELKDTVLVCDASRLIFTNRDALGEKEPFEARPLKIRASYQKPITLYGYDLDLFVISNENMLHAFIARNGGAFLILMLINIIFLRMMMYILERVMITRIKHLEESFGIMEGEKVQLIDGIDGNDEITNLANSYNEMAEKMNELIHTVYLDRLREQEMDIAKQKAELLALHSQINPHFLFNVLESIRMHSLLKSEKETAQMVGKLAVMERTYVNWGNDEISVAKEMDFVEAYLSLQKYRFGDRLSYRLIVADDCKQFTLPKLTIVTFVENACEHGVEKKANPGWIFVRIQKNENRLCIEVEDTGMGMSPEELSDIRGKVESVSIQSVQKDAHIGMMNAFLRLKLLTDNRASFEIESEQGEGTTIRLWIPIDSKA